MSITFILNLFLLQSACGMVFLCLFLPKDQVDRLFFKTISFLSFAFITAALFMRWKHPFTLPENFGFGSHLSSYPYVNGLYGIIAALAFVAWLCTRFSQTKPIKMWLNSASFLALPAVAFDSLLFIPKESTLTVPAALIPINFVTAALLLGGFLIGMIFGRWYFINGVMPKRLLVRTSVILGGTLILKILTVGVTWLWLYTGSGPDHETIKILTSMGGYGIFFWQRIIVGLAIPAVTAYIAWASARADGNQSVTGIMYVGVAFIFVGELVAKFLFLFSTIPL